MKVFIPTRFGVFISNYCDYIKIKKEGWVLSPTKSKTGYISPRVFRCKKNPNGGKTLTEFALYSRLVLEPKKHELVDHISRSTLDNTRGNLRIANKITNGQNMRSTKGKSRYKGVCLRNKKKPHHKDAWRAYITVDKKRIELGTHKTQEKAAEVYNTAALKYFGEFACLNKIV